MIRVVLFAWTAFIVSLLIPLCAPAETWKLATLFPEGTKCADTLKLVAKEIEEKTAGKIKFKVFFGGAQGDESDVLRKIRIGQLHGGIFTGRSLGEVNGDMRVMEIPFNFPDRARGQEVLKNLIPFFSQGILRNGFKSLGIFELGPIYLISVKPVKNLDELHGIKIWSWDGDPLVAAIIEAMGFVSVPLPLPEVLPSLSTGIVEAAYAPPVGIVALQWSSKIKYLLDLQLSYSLGAILITKKEWDKLSPTEQKLVDELMAPAIQKINQANIEENQEALITMKALGIEFITFPPADVQESQAIRLKLIQKLKGNLFSLEAYNLLQKELK
jgi:TRAP-type transport system periplasmic protein